MVNTLFSKVLGENEKCFLFLRICLQCRRPQFDSWVGKIPLEKGKATDSSILAWRIPWTEEPGGLQSTVSQRVGHNWVAKHSTVPTPAFLGFLVAQTVKNPPAIQETRVRSLGWGDPLEKGMATHSSIVAWRIPKDRGAWRDTVHGVAKSPTRLTN